MLKYISHRLEEKFKNGSFDRSSKWTTWIKWVKVNELQQHHVRKITVVFVSFYLNSFKTEGPMI